MSMRETNEYGLVLSYRSLSGNEEKDIEQCEKHLNAFLASLRKKAKTENWAYEIKVCPSTTDPRNYKKERLHIHLYIKGNPALTIAKYIKEYWHKRHGIANYRKVDCGIIGYMEAQALFSWRQEYQADKLVTCDHVETIENTTIEGVSEVGSPLMSTNIDTDIDTTMENNTTQTSTGMEKTTWVNRLNETACTRLYFARRKLQSMWGGRSTLVWNTC